jgi:DNA polymerase-3 subunit epsilon
VIGWLRRTPLAAARWVAIDCETSGLDPASDRLLAVGALPLHGGRIAVGEGFAALVRQAEPSAPANILVHGIGGEAQLAGRPLAQVMQELEAFVGDGVPVAFHAPFDAEVLRRHGLRPRAQWLDLAVLAPVLFPARKAKLLDDWLAAFDIAPLARHDALGDAFAAAQLLLVALREAERQGLDTVEALRKVARAGRWLRGMNAR